MGEGGNVYEITLAPGRYRVVVYPPEGDSPPPPGQAPKSVAILTILP